MPFLEFPRQDLLVECLYIYIYFFFFKTVLIILIWDAVFLNDKEKNETKTNKQKQKNKQKQNKTKNKTKQNKKEKNRNKNLSSNFENNIINQHQNDIPGQMCYDGFTCQMFQPCGFKTFNPIIVSITAETKIS